MALIFLRNADVARIIAGIPRGHYHLRLVIEARDGTRIVLHEATVAAIVRAYANIVMHPTRRALELVQACPETRKPGYARHQLVESPRGEEEVLDELEEVLGMKTTP